VGAAEFRKALIPLLLAARADPNLGPANSSPLCSAVAISGIDVDIVKWLISAGAAVNANCNEFEKPLDVAMRNNPAAAEALRDAGARRH
jgi:ankyrin repeat protein